MPVRITTIVSGLLYFIFFAGFNGTLYFLHNLLQDVAFLLILCLFIASAFFCGLRKTSFSWSLVFFTPLLLCLYLMIVPALSWSNLTGANPVPSIAAARGFLMILIFPSLIFLIELKFPVEKIVQIFIQTAVIVTLLYLVHYFRIDMLSYYHSTDVWKRAQVLVDSWRGYRLIAPLLAFNIASVVSYVMIFQSKQMMHKLAWAGVFLITIYCWFLIMARQEIAMLIAGVICYHIWFAYKVRLGLFFTCVLIAIPIIIVGSYELFVHLSQAGVNDKVRYYAYLQAHETVISRPFFGAGVGSYKSIHEGQVFEGFSSTDIGALGILFRYGIVGFSLYYGLFFYVVSQVLKAHFAYRKYYRTYNILLIFVLIRAVKEPFTLMFSTDYAFIQGIMLLAVGLAIAKTYLKTLLRKSSTATDSPISIKPLKLA